MNIADEIDLHVFHLLSGLPPPTLMSREDLEKLYPETAVNDVHRGTIPFIEPMDPDKWPSNMESFQGVPFPDQTPMDGAVGPPLTEEELEALYEKQVTELPSYEGMTPLERIQDAAARKIAWGQDEEILTESRSPEERLLDITRFLGTGPTDEEIFEFIIADIRKEWTAVKGITMMQYDLMQSCKRKLQEREMSNEESLTPEEEERVGAALEIGAAQQAGRNAKYESERDVKADGALDDRKFDAAELENMWDEETGKADTETAAYRAFRVMDLSECEKVRIYVYSNGEMRFDNPQKLFISEESGTHRVLSQDGWVTYLPAGWRCIRWLPLDADQPVTY